MTRHRSYVDHGVLGGAHRRRLELDRDDLHQRRVVVRARTTLVSGHIGQAGVPAQLSAYTYGQLRQTAASRRSTTA
jgi:hypothetical protein